jgi:hypothetical protein
LKNTKTGRNFTYKVMFVGIHDRNLKSWTEVCMKLESGYRWSLDIGGVCMKLESGYRWSLDIGGVCMKLESGYR